MEQVDTSTQDFPNSLIGSFNNTYDDLQLPVKNEAEIVRLSLSAANANDAGETERNDSQNDERVPRIEFRCSACSMMEMVHYYGKAPPFVYGLQILENSYVMRDPFQPPSAMRWKPRAEYFVVIGAKCFVCENVVCKAAECSFYYTNTYCLNCAKEQINKFPIEAQAKLRNQLAQE